MRNNKNISLVQEVEQTTKMQNKQSQVNILSQKLNSKIKQMFKRHLTKVENMNQQKAFGGKNSKYDKNDKVYRDIAQLQVKIKQGIFKALRQSQCLRKERKDLYENKMGKFVQILKDLHEKKSIRIKINDSFEKMIVQASLVAEQASSVLKRFQKQGTGWCGRTTEFKIPLQRMLVSLCEYGFLFQNISKFDSITNDSVKQIYLPVQYSEKEFRFIENELVRLWPKPIIKNIEVIKQVQVIKESNMNSQTSRIAQAHELYLGWTRPQQAYRAIKIYQEETKKSLSRVSACNALGMIYQAGKHLPKDMKRALRYYRQAQKLNSAQAMHRIGQFLQKGLINSKEQFQGKYPNRQSQVRGAIEYYQKAAKLGHLDAITDLGFIYENGIKNENGEFVVDSYPQHAVEYYKKGKKQQFPRALNNLGSYLIKNDKHMGGSNNQNVDKGIRYLTRAKQLKYPKAFLNLGKCYQNGIGVLQSVDMARASYLQGIQAGEPTCKMEYIRTHLAEKIQDSKVMIKLAQLCRQVLLKDQSNPEANYFMGLFCEKGIGTQKNKESSFYYIEKAARRNHPAALVKLGDYYYSGYFVEKNYDYAKKLYDMANEKGNTQALLNINLMREKGLVEDNGQMSPQRVYEGAARMGNANGVLYSGINKSPQEQRQALLKAAQMGSIQAVDILKKTEPMWLTKKSKQGNITHSEWQYKNTKSLVQPVLDMNNMIRTSSKTSTFSKKSII